MSHTLTPDTNRKTSWRARQYGKHRSRRQNFRAWFFASAHGRQTLRQLREIKREQRRQA